MGKNIKWVTEMDTALFNAKKENKSILLDFFNPGWIGCQQMDAVSYPDKDVIEFISNFMIPLQISFDAQPLSQEFKVKWTPTLVTLDQDGIEHHRSVGFLSPEELIPSLMLGISKVYFDQNKFNEALESLRKIIEDYPKSDSTPEAIYLQAVSGYKSTEDPKQLKDGYELLKSGFPQSEWTKRAYPYSLLWGCISKTCITWKKELKRPQK